MKIVIDIPQGLKIDFENENWTALTCAEMKEALMHGTPLPEGHGRLIDVGRIDKDMMDHDNPIIYLTMNGEYIEAVSLDYLDSLPTIIEADKE